MNPITSTDRTYNWQLQPYVSWKGNNYKSLGLINFRPETNGSWILSKQPSSSLDGNAFLPRPLKQWRKQLMDNPIRKGTRNITINEIESPGLIINTILTIEDNKLSNKNFIVSNLQMKNNSNIYDNTESTITYADVSNCWNDPIGKRICCNPEANLIRYKTAPLEKNYISYSYYLKNRCYTYNQNISTTKVTGNTYFTPGGMAIYPTEFPNGCQVLHKKECSNDCCRCYCGTNGRVQDMIYKPNNRQFAKQGATSSRSRTNALKTNTIEQGGALFNNANGLKQINNGICELNGDSIYYLKTKPVGMH